MALMQEECPAINFLYRITAMRTAQIASIPTAVAVKQWRLSGGGQAVAELSDDHDRFLPTLESQSSFGRRRCILIDSTLILSLSAVAAFGNHLSDSHLYAVAVYATMDVPHEPLLPCIPHKG